MAHRLLAHIGSTCLRVLARFSLGALARVLPRVPELDERIQAIDARLLEVADMFDYPVHGSHGSCLLFAALGKLSDDLLGRLTQPWRER